MDLSGGKWLPPSKKVIPFLTKIKFHCEWINFFVLVFEIYHLQFENAISPNTPKCHYEHTYCILHFPSLRIKISRWALVKAHPRNRDEQTTKDMLKTLIYYEHSLITRPLNTQKCYKIRENVEKCKISTPIIEEFGKHRSFMIAWPIKLLKWAHVCFHHDWSLHNWVKRQCRSCYNAVLRFINTDN